MFDPGVSGQRYGSNAVSALFTLQFQSSILPNDHLSFTQGEWIKARGGRAEKPSLYSAFVACGPCRHQRQANLYSCLGLDRVLLVALLCASLVFDHGTPVPTISVKPGTTSVVCPLGSDS